MIYCLHSQSFNLHEKTLNVGGVKIIIQFKSIILYSYLTEISTWKFVLLLVDFIIHIISTKLIMPYFN